MKLFAFLISLFIHLNANAAASAGVPDLIVYEPRLAASIIIKTINIGPDSCTVNEGCTGIGERRLLAFTTEVRNIGTADLFLGDPAGNPLFHWDICHQHYHFDNFLTYQLIASDGAIIAGHKQSFCVMDGTRWTTSRKGTKQRKYFCSFQGIQAGWADTYANHLDCNWIDITDVPAGIYTLSITVNSFGVLAEGSLANNTASVPVIL